MVVRLQTRLWWGATRHGRCASDFRVRADLMRQAAGGSLCIPDVMLLQQDLVLTPFVEGLEDR